ncbi:MAG: hypothetical protein KAT68_11065 [Bacteroidales bacterium]|nr:hypothetical protein [Bacteroidales bacterium]
MKIRYFKYLIIILSVLISFVSCNHEETQQLDFTIKEFVPISNWEAIDESFINNNSKKAKCLFLDYENAIDSGFYIPSANQVEKGKFVFTFSVKNNTDTLKHFFYKIYYQNESYKFPENDSKNHEKENEFAHENFYGSWLDTHIGFKSTGIIPADNKFHKIKNSFCIAGNPRNEEKYFYNEENDRWKRNPRTGNYSFLLVVSSEKNIQDSVIPQYIVDISKKKNNQFVNPYYYFLYGKGKKIKNTVVKKSLSELKVIAKPNLGNGIYINKSRFKGKNIDTVYYSSCCGDNQEIYKNASFEQFIHYIDASVKFNNIPVIADVLNDGYSKMDYNYNKQFFYPEELIGTIPLTAPYPCQSVYSDPELNKIVIRNLKSTFGNWQKQSVGIISRHGLTYGKYTIKAKLTELLNKDNVWNGITNAIWLIYQGGRGGAWNARRACTDGGYMATYWGGRNDERKEVVSYSEIDFEILKTVPYCPDYKFPPVYNTSKTNQNNIYDWNVSFPDDVLEYDNKIVVACTNWDMACPQPKNYKKGCNPIIYEDTTFESHRWEDVYRALTQKSLQIDDILFGSEYYYFQIDWRPTEIIWKIGAEKDKLKVIGYMNNTVTSIPNNQMLMIVTQEFHNTKWWPGTQYEQGFIPFPKNDIVGEIYEFTIE